MTDPKTDVLAEALPEKWWMYAATHSNAEFAVLLAERLAARGFVLSPVSEEPGLRAAVGRYLWGPDRQGAFAALSRAYDQGLASLDAARDSAGAGLDELPVLDWTFDNPAATYDLPGRCLTCGARFMVRRNKGTKPPLSVECPSCECTEYSWRDGYLAVRQPVEGSEK